MKVNLNQLDLDRLHATIDKIVDGEYIGRQEGKTTAILTLMLGEAMLGGKGNQYLYVGQNYRWTQEVRKIFAQLLEDEGFLVQLGMNQMTMRVVEQQQPDPSKPLDEQIRPVFQTYHFIPMSDPTLLSMPRGKILDDVWVDITPEVQGNFDPQIWAFLQSRMNRS